MVLLGPCRPGVAYLTRAQRASLGVVISASHNAVSRQRHRFFGAPGTKLPDAWEARGERALAEPPVGGLASLGKARSWTMRRALYRVLQSTFPQDLTSRA